VVEATETSQGSCTVAPGGVGTTTVTCALGTLAVGSGAIVTVTVTADAAIAGTTVVNSATATSPTIVTPPVSTADLTVRPATDLSITKSADRTTADPGGAVEYTVTVTNAGPATAEDVQVVDHLPEAIDPGTPITATPTGGGTCVVTERVVACDWSTLAPSATVTVVIDATFAATVASVDKRAVNVAEVSALTDELDPSDNAADVEVKVIPFADLEASAFGPGIVAPGETATLIFVNANNGPSTATDATTEITVPVALEILSASPGCTVGVATVTCSAGTLPAAASATVEILVRAPVATIGTTTIAEVAVASLVDDPIPENNEAVVPLETPPAPVVERVEPAEGPESGGTAITVVGDNFDDETTVELGGAACLDVVFVTAGQLQCTTPPGDPGPVDVVVTTADGQQAVRPGGFTYRATPIPTFTG
jgi:uncharacterized repeat protein (TIGR01451 family)